LISYLYLENVYILEGETVVISRFFGKKRSRSDKSNTPTNTSKVLSREERDKLWDQKIAQHQYEARAEDREIEEEERRRARAEKIKQRDEQILRDLRELDRKGTEAAKNITKKGKKAAKGFAKDMWTATKVAAKGLGDWADRVVPDEKPAKRKTKVTRTTVAKATKRKPKVTIKHTGAATNKAGLPKYATINGKRYTRAGPLKYDSADAFDYAAKIRANGLDATVKKMSNGEITAWTVWYRPKTTVKRPKRKANNSWC
jgi:hypothetical protein